MIKKRVASRVVRSQPPKAKEQSVIQDKENQNPVNKRIQRSTSKEHSIASAKQDPMHVPKIGNSRLPVKKAPKFTLEAIKEAPSRKAQGHSPTKKVSLADNKQRQVRPKKEPSRYMLEIIKLNLVELVHKYDIH